MRLVRADDIGGRSVSGDKANLGLDAGQCLDEDRPQPTLTSAEHYAAPDQ